MGRVVVCDGVGSGLLLVFGVDMLEMVCCVLCVSVL